MIIIEGITASGRKFRPSAWAEMLIEGVGLAHFGIDHKIHYLPYIEPATINGNAAILMDEELEKIRPEAYKEILHFAKENHLVMHYEPGSVAQKRASLLGEMPRRDSRRSSPG
ncbi:MULTISPECIES: DUF3579 domain-containing protein [Acidithiobacillus]|jgi:hypothetical protein|uniref:DUF3579 domain-containing protein n=4 Tax=Acidithiobacillus caldus TaxID=33059 RepID=F9ZSV8_ACICS|nr:MULTISPECIES: DUF3579 domain-containing protein [Acidithiobacillus]AEK57040.1 conserved hypothetical protein [Acidithiobacillus caldus SM-1]AIA54306.1 hypothetical protein Acaty_c0416 [Acidithiobacillus caldus ATCC 51756]AUW31828.1 DUF3579 domain-containing protein [Acidithiobacillus caldus]MBU2728699.1 DUF3579 domain-containing protein [Acidithiobacillus caldus]MBU2734677.1 DUF3579 domain-containing protein [Acidithiobacillus caldus ATCC 51756]